MCMHTHDIGVIMTKNRFQIAKNDIVQFFDKSDNKVFSLSDISKILETDRKFWRLPVNMTAEEFANLLVKHTDLKLHKFEFRSKTITRFTWGNISTLNMAYSLEKNSYFSHYTALYLHELTDQIPKKIYVTHEQTPKPRKDKP